MKNSSIVPVVALIAVLWGYQWYTAAPDGSELGEAYVSELAEIARETARKCRAHEFKTHAEMMAYPKAAGAESRRVLFDEPIEKRLETVNEKLDGAYDADEYAREWDRIAEGLGG